MNAVLLLSALMMGQCGPNGCPLPRLAPPAAVQVRPYFVIGTHSIRHNGLTFQVRGYIKNAATGVVTWEPGDEWNRLSYAAAVSRDAAENADRKSSAREADKALNFGMEPARMKTGPKTTATSDEARLFVKEARADSPHQSLLHVTVIGTDDERAPVVHDLMNNPAFASLKPTMLVQDYTREEWPVDPSLGFVTTGKPTIIVQTAKGPADPKGGRVVYRASDYSMGPEALADAIRKANPDYKPSVDPGPSTGKPSASACPLGFTRYHWPVILIVGVGLVLLNRLPRKGV
jgi:hypothetical protein